MRRKYSVLCAGLAFIFLTACGASSHPATQAAKSASSASPQGSAAPIEAQIAYSGISEQALPLWIAKQQHLFAKYGVKAHITYISGGVKTTQALVAGDIDMAQVAGPAVVSADVAGFKVAMVAGFVNVMPYDLVVVPGITSIADLKGKNIAVNSIGSLDYAGATYALKKYGLNPKTDVTFIPTGNPGQRFAALQKNAVQAAVFTAPITYEAHAKGYRTLVDLKAMAIPFQATGMAVTRKVLQAKPRLVVRVLRAIVAAIHIFRTNRKVALAVAKKYLGNTNPTLLAKSYNEYHKLYFIHAIPYPTVAGIQRLLNLSRSPKAKAISATSIVDDAPLKAIAKAGFLKTLH